MRKKVKYCVKAGKIKWRVVRRTAHEACRSHALTKDGTGVENVASAQVAINSFKIERTGKTKPIVYECVCVALLAHA